MEIKPVMEILAQQRKAKKNLLKFCKNNFLKAPLSQSRAMPGLFFVNLQED